MPEIASPHARAVAAELEAAGHDVWQCHDDVGSPCRAMRGQPCPLDAAPIEVAVTARPWAAPQPLPTEGGILCATRRHLPVVVTGAARAHPFRAAATVEAGSADVAAVISAVATGVAADHTAVAADALRQHLPPQHADAAHAVVRRRLGGGLRVTVSARPQVPRATVVAAAVRVAAALRAFDPWAASLDVSVEEES